MRKQYTWRSFSLAILYALIGLSIIVHIVRIQNSPEAEVFRKQGDRYAGEFRTVYPARGEIYDRDGYLLAGNKTVYEIGVDLQAVRDAQTIALAISSNLGLDYNEVYQNIAQPPSEDRIYVVLADFVPAEKAAALQQYKIELANRPVESQTANRPSLAGLEFKAHLQRSYPEDALASNVLGFVNREGQGFFGVEEHYDDLLAGSAVTVWFPEDPNRVEERPQVPNGTTLILTLDRELQTSVEQILDQALANNGARSGSIIVMDAHNGEILAMASTPRLDLNEFWYYDQIYNNASEFNRAISMPYEPGSVFKVLTMAAALDSGAVLPSTQFLDTGIVLIGGAYIQNWNQEAWGLQDMTGCLQYSLNVCMASLALQMGPQTFYQYLQRFGIGHPTGVDLAGEAAGRLKVPGDADWYPVDLGTNAFGQGVATTPVQMMMAASAIANQGKMVTPHLLYAMVKNGQQYNTPPSFAGTPVSAETARALNEMLVVSLEREASLALVNGYRVAGKTGTAQIPTPYGLYASDVTNTSFIGWGPADEPRFMVYVWLEEPSSSIWGSETAAPVFAQVVEKAVVLLDIPPDYIRQQLAAR